MGWKAFQLSDENINAIVEEIREYFISRGISEKDVLKLSLLIEEALLRYRDKFGPDQEVSVQTSQIAGPRVIIRIKSDGFDPLQEDDPNSILGSAYLKNLLQSEGTSTTFRKRLGYNEIVATARKERKKRIIPGGAITVAVILAVVAALITKRLPDRTADLLVNELATPLLSRLLDLVLMITGPLICISIISGICALGDIATLNSIGLRAIRRFTVITILMIVYAVIVSFCSFRDFRGP